MHVEILDHPLSAPSDDGKADRQHQTQRRIQDIIEARKAAAAHAFAPADQAKVADCPRQKYQRHQRHSVTCQHPWQRQGDQAITPQHQCGKGKEAESHGEGGGAAGSKYTFSRPARHRSIETKATARCPVHMHGTGQRENPCGNDSGGHDGRLALMVTMVFPPAWVANLDASPSSYAGRESQLPNARPRSAHRALATTATTATTAPAYTRRL